MAGSTERSGLLSYFQAHCLIPQLLPNNYWIPRWPLLLDRWGSHHSTIYPSPLIIRSCGECAREDIDQHGFARHKVAQLQFPTAHGVAAVTLTTGIVDLAGTHVSEEQMIAAADQALYRAKAAGRNRVEIAAAPSESGSHVG